MHALVEDNALVGPKSAHTFLTILQSIFIFYHHIHRITNRAPPLVEFSPAKKSTKGGARLHCEATPFYPAKLSHPTYIDCMNRFFSNYSAVYYMRHGSKDGPSVSEVLC